MDYLYLAVVLAVYFCYRHENKKLKEELSNVKREFDILAVKTGNETLSPYYIGENMEKKMLFFIKKGKKVEAVKFLRQNKKMSLIDARDIVDSVEKKYSEEINLKV